MSSNYCDVINGKNAEASSHDQIKMTKFLLEYDRKILHPQTLTLEHDRKNIFRPSNFRL